MSDFLEYLLGSRTKSRIIKTLILNPKAEFTADELAGKIKCPPRSVSYEMRKMHLFGLLKCRHKKRRKHYKLDRGFVFFPDLKNVVGKCNITPESRLLIGIKNSGKIIYAVLTGIFTENKKAGADLLVVGEELKRGRLKRLVAEIEADIGKEIRYAVLSSQELFYRMEMFDKFIIDINKGPHITLVDKIKERKKVLHK
ncbi:MAG: hypothetical protein ABIC19_02480 [Patescibacteria group bacterium]|nr:helix-turn-helix domain-containing protein [Patescibacteria group bacterium]